MSLAILESVGTSEVLLLVVFGIVVVVTIGFVGFLVTQRNRKLKKCPFCAEWIRPDAVGCRFCGSNLELGGEVTGNQ